jgi:hypothetical protein
VGAAAAADADAPADAGPDRPGSPAWPSIATGSLSLIAGVPMT